MAALRKLKTITNLLIFSSYKFKVMFSVFYQFFVSSVFTGLGCDFRNNTGIDKGHTTVLLGTLRSNDASAMRTSLKK